MKIVSNRFKYFLIFLIGVVLFIAVSFIGIFSFDYKVILGSILYFTAIVIANKIVRNSTTLILLAFALPVLFAFTFINIFHFSHSWISLPSNLFLLASIITGHLFYKSNNVLWPVLIVALVGMWQYKGSSLYKNYMQFHTIDGKVSEQYTSQISLYDTMGVKIYPLLTSKTLILDFWNSHCAPCFEIFPFIDSTSKIIDKSKYEIFAVNIPLNGETKEANYHLLDKYNYSFNKLFSIDDDILDSFKIEYFPTTLVIKNAKIIFRGEFEESLKFLGVK